mgnify:CR=1 FL=1
MNHSFLGKVAFLVCTTLSISFSVNSQITVNNGYTAQQLGNNLAGNNVNIYNATISGGAIQYGLFQYTGTDLGLNSGVILSTGSIFDAVGPNNQGGTSTNVGGPGNADLTALAGFQTNDAVVFNFDFEVQGDEIEFKFVFLSEEYNEYVNSGFNDVFAFYISGPGITGQQNLAVVPGTTTPVTINTINNNSFWQFYNDNTDNGTNIEYDGFTTLMTASKSGLQPCGIYTLSLRIADGSDSAFDSAVLLQENSLVQSNISASSNTFSGNNTALEGCIEASFTFALDSALSYDVTIPIGIGGTATNGVDYSFIDNLITIPAGQLSSTLIIDAVADGLTEGQEVVELYFTPSPCEPVDTVLLYIDDYIPLEYNVDPTDVTCFGADNGQVDLTVSGGISPYTLTLTDSLTGDVNSFTTFPVAGLTPGTYYVDVIDGYGCSAEDIIAGNIFDAGTTFIPDGQGGSYSSTINLGGFGASQSIQSPDQIQSICATLEHSRIGELEITLTAPNGQMITLKQQPGGATCNLGEPCAVGPTDGGSGNSNTDPGIGYNYCWQTISTYATMVGESNNFTYTYTNPCDGSQQSDKYLPSGSYQPYEGFDNFIGAPLNGGWTITVTDHIPNNNGYIFDWSIVLQANPPDSVFTILEPAGPAISHTSVSPACGASNGSINLTVTGTGPFTYLWNNGATTQDLTNIPAGAYAVTITGPNACTYSYEVDLSNNGTLTISGIVTNEVCASQNNGAINVTVAGGTAPISYNWSNGSIAEDVSGLSPGSYTVNVTDATGCLGVQTYNVLGASNINISGTTVNETCGDEDGSISVTVNGAVAPITYSWSNGSTTEDLDQINQGTYVLSLTDANGCSATASYSIVNLVGNCVPNCDLAITNQTVTNESCGNSNGSVNITVFTTNGPAQYLWNNGVTTEDISGLQVGTYAVTITDNEGCTVNQQYTVSNQSGSLSITGINTTNENCGNNQGGADATITGGVQPYFYSWSNGSTTQDLTGVAAGTYTLTVTDASGCSVYQTVTIQNISGTLTQTYGNAVNEVCSNSAGSIDIQISGGQTPYTYLWSNGATTQDLTGLSAGTYSCTITDNNGCTINTPIYTVGNNSGTLAISNIDTDNEICTNGLGDITVTISGGTAPYTFLWNTGATTQNLPNLSAGTYSLTVSDNSGCSLNSGNLVILNESGTLQLTGVSTFDELCGNGTGSINVSVTGGTAPISYLWSNGSTSQDITNLSAGDYSLVITDLNNCQIDVSTSINNDPGSLTIDNMVTTIELCGQMNGAINLVYSGAGAPSSFNWSNGATSEDITGISAGTYTVTITDVNGCQASSSAVVNNIANGMTIASSIVESEFCGNGAGSINLSISGGTAPLTYLWSNGQTTEDLSGLSSGIYSCTITDATGCELNAGPFEVVNSPGTLNVSVQSIINEVCGNNGGSINASVTGGTAPYSYSWSNGATTEDISGLSAGTYTLNVTGSNGCTDMVSAVIDNLSGTLTASAIINDEICGNNNGSINLTVSGGNAPYTYLWSNGATTQDLSGLSAGNFSVTVSDASGCSFASGNYVINDNSGNFDVTGINVTNEVCGDGMGYIDLIVAGANGTVSYSRSNGSTTQDLSNLSSGTYSGTATDISGCTISFSASVFNEAGQMNASSVNVSPTCNTANGSIDLTVLNGSAPLSFLWSNGSTTEDIASIQSGNYTVNITDNNGCMLTYTTTLSDQGIPTIGGISITDETCGNSNGSITVNVSGGTAPYTYSWSGATSNPCCSYTLDMQDLGNSWNGASIDVLVDGTNAGNFTVFGGGQNTGTFNVCAGESIELIWNPGGFDNEVSFDLLDGSGNIVFSQGASPTPGTIFTGTGSCVTQPLTGPSISNLQAGNYNVTVTDANGCQDSTVITVNNTSGNLQITSEVVSNETCSDNNGSINISVSGDAPFVYSWNNGSVSQDLSDLNEGLYTVTISDQSGCSLTESYTINNITNGLVLDNVVILEDNCGQGTGSIDISASGGVGSLSYIWNNGYTAEDISNLAAGSYSVIISDGSNCSLEETFVVTNNTGTLVVSEVTSNETCGSGNGTIDITVTGGVAPYTFDWSNGAATEDLGGLNSGSYEVVITDNNGCIFSSSYSVISASSGILLTATTTGDNCANNSGAINLTVSGGTSPYTYQWSNGPTTQDMNNLSYGPYTVVVTDANGCSETATYAVQSTGNINPSNVVITPETCGNSNGGINLSFAGPGQPNQYLWSNGATTQDITNVPAGWYWVQMSTTFGPGGGCTVMDSFFVASTQGTLSIDSLIVTHETCSSGNAAINAYISGGTAPYSYQWSNGSTTEDLSGVSAGTFALVVTDNNGCESTLSEEILNLTYGFGVSASIIANEQCGDASGAIDVTISGGSAPYIYLWNNGATTEDLSGLNGGTYSLTITDNNGCSVDNEFVVTNNTNGFEITSSVIDETCGNQNGAIDLTISGGSSPITFNWSNGSTTEDLSDLLGGNYTCVVTDNTGCIINIDETVQSFSSTFTMGTSIITDENCGDATGSIELNPTGGTAPLTYSWDLSNPCCSYTLNMYDLNNNGWGGTPTPGVIVSVNGNVVGTYMVPVGNGNSFESVTIPVCTGDEISFEYVAANQNQNNTYEVLDGDGNVIFEDGPNPFAGVAFTTTSACSFPNVNALTGLNAGDYPVTITDAYGCQVTDVFTVNNITGDFAVTTTSIGTICNGDQGSIDLTATGGTSPYTYQWSNGQTTEDITAITAGSYDVTVTDNVGCMINETIVVGNTGNPVDYTGVVISHATCATCNDGSIDISLAGNSAPYTFSWSSSETTEDISGLTPGDYSVTVTNGDGCDTTITFTVLNTAGLDDITNIQYQITPNPNNGQFTLTAVNFTGDQLVVKVFDATGRIVYDSPLKYVQGESIDMNLQFLEAGSYMLSIEGSGRISQKRIVIY